MFIQLSDPMQKPKGHSHAEATSVIERKAIAEEFLAFQSFIFYLTLF
jgi:hypothetical protein